MPRNAFRRNLSPHRFAVVRKRYRPSQSTRRDGCIFEILSRHKTRVVADRNAELYRGPHPDAILVRRLTEKERYQQ